MSTRIFFDARFIRYEHHDGISRFSAGLAEALHAQRPITAIICDQRQLLKLPRGIDYLMANDPTDFWRELTLARKLNRAGAEVVFCPMQTMGSFGRRYKLILTLHDLIYYNHPSPPPALPWHIRLVWRLFHLSYLPQRVLLNRADAVVTVSETTKRLMLRHRLTKRPITVIPNAAGSLARGYEHRQPEVRPRLESNLIYMGSFMDYKNVETLVRGMALLPDHRLHLLSAISKERRAQLEGLAGDSASRLVFHGGVSESEYHRLLDASVALVSASLDEGFGIPLVEAMQRGIPVICSNIEIFREIGGPAALFFDPRDEGSFAAAVKGFDDALVWKERSLASIEQSKRFDWSLSAGKLGELADFLANYVG